MGPAAGHGVGGIALGAGRQAGAERRGGDAAGAEHVGVGEQDLGGHAFGVDDPVAGVGVMGGAEPAVAAGLLLPFLHELVRVLEGPLELGHRLLMLVEALAELRVEIVAVDVRRRTGVAVGRDHEIAVHRFPSQFSNVVRE